MFYDGDVWPSTQVGSSSVKTPAWLIRRFEWGHRFHRQTHHGFGCTGKNRHYPGCNRSGEKAKDFSRVWGVEKKMQAWYIYRKIRQNYLFLTHICSFQFFKGVECLQLIHETWVSVSIRRSFRNQKYQRCLKVWIYRTKVMP